MTILGTHTVELTPEEARAHLEFEIMLGFGHSCEFSANRVAEIWPTLDPAFFRWLRGEPLFR